MPGLAKKPALLAEYYPFLVAAMDEAEINTPKRAAAFLAQVGHESADFRYMKEIWGPTKTQLGYDRRADLGNTEPEAVAAARAHGMGPGKFYMGHGPIQITGYANHKAAGEALGIDAVNEPELLAKPANAFRGACWFWTTHNLNRYADADKFETLTRKINGGLNGLDDRLERWAVAKRALAGHKSAPPAIAPVPNSGELDATAAVTQTPAAVADIQPAVPAIEPVAGGTVTDEPVKANSASLVTKITSWGLQALKVGGIGTAIGTASAAITSVSGLSERAQLILVVLFAGLVVLAVLAAALYFIIGALAALWDHLQTKALRADPTKTNVK